MCGQRRLVSLSPSVGDTTPVSLSDTPSGTLLLPYDLRTVTGRVVTVGTLTRWNLPLGGRGPVVSLLTVEYPLELGVTG